MKNLKNDVVADFDGSAMSHEVAQQDRENERTRHGVSEIHPSKNTNHFGRIERMKNQTWRQRETPQQKDKSPFPLRYCNEDSKSTSPN